MLMLLQATLERLVRIAAGDDDPVAPPPTRWGPASWWRIGLVAMALMILALAIWPWLG